MQRMVESFSKGLFMHFCLALASNLRSVSLHKRVYSCNFGYAARISFQLTVAGPHSVAISTVYGSDHECHPLIIVGTQAFKRALRFWIVK